MARNEFVLKLDIRYIEWILETMHSVMPDESDPLRIDLCAQIEGDLLLKRLELNQLRDDG